MEYCDFKKNTEEQILELKNHEIDQKETLPLLRFPLLEQTGMVEHCFTTRGGGVSKGIFSSLNLSFTRGDDHEAVFENYCRLAKAMNVTCDDFVFTDQTHTTNVIRVTRKDAGNGIIKERPYHDVDGLVTNEPGLVLSTFFADCVPLFFVDPVHRAIGLSHSGWRGTVKRMGQVTLDKMKQEFGTNPQDVIAAVGPSICQDCYEVSEDVAIEFEKEFENHKEDILIAKPDGKYQLDLWMANRIVLTEAGILPQNLAVTNICTCCNDKLLFSHRASQGKRGNLGAFMYIK